MRKVLASKHLISSLQGPILAALSLNPDKNKTLATMRNYLQASKSIIPS